MDNGAKTADNLTAYRRPAVGGSKNSEISPSDRLNGADYAHNNNFGPERSVRNSTGNRRWRSGLKIFSLLIALLAAVWTIWGDRAAGNHSETRIAELESLLKNSVKTIDALNGKIEVLESEWKRSAARIGRAESSSGESNSAEWLSKEEFNKFVEGFDKRIGESEYGSHPDEIRKELKKLVPGEEGESENGDGIEQFDYGIGGMIVDHSPPHLGGEPLSFWAHYLLHQHAKRILEPGSSEPKDCFEFRGRSGYVVIELPKAVIPDSFTIEHVAEGNEYERLSAPKHCRVWGWLHKQPKIKIVFAEFTYDMKKKNAQNFKVLNNATSTVIDVVKLEFTSNHGMPFTCICRFKVHGSEP